MGDGSLSQDEIDALLQGTDDVGSGTSIPNNFVAQEPEQTAPLMSVAEQDSVMGVLRSVVATVVPPLSGYLGGREISLINVSIEAKPRNVIISDFPGRHIQVAMDFQGALSGKNLVIYSAHDAGIISSIMMSNEMDASVELTDAHLSTIQEFTNQFMSLVGTQLANRLGGAINATSPALAVVNNPSELRIPQANPVKVTYDLNIEGLAAFRIYHIIDANVSSTLTSMASPARMGQRQFQQQQPYQQGYPQGGQPQQNIQQYSQHPSDMSYVKFPPLDPGIPQTNMGDISILLDVPMTLTVELGRTSRLIQDILGLGEGSIIELDKLAGEAVDLLVNGKLIAKGEVVVIDENFGVRITDIVSPDERLLRINH